MAAPGRKPNLTIVKTTTGKKGRGINEQEPVFNVKIPSCPMPLDKVGAKEWKEISKLLFDAGVLTEADKRTLAIYCRIWSQIVLLSEKIQTVNDYISFDIKLNSETGEELSVNCKTNPLAMRLENLLAEHRAYSALLGLDPLNRTRIKASPPAKPKKDGKDRFF